MRLRFVILAAAALAGAAHGAGNLVVDGSFSTGLASWNPVYTDPSDSDFVYSFSGSDIFDVACIATSCLASGPIQNLRIAQLIPTPALGLFRLSFDIRSLSTFPPGNEINASFGGVRLYRSEATEIADWRHIALLGKASASTSALSFDFIAPSGNYYLSNVSLVSAVPEPHSYLMLLAGLAVVGWAARRGTG